jgi:hypothetical protein
MFQKLFSIKPSLRNDDNNDGMNSTNRKTSSKVLQQKQSKSSTLSSSNAGTTSGDATNAIEAKEEEQVMIPTTNQSLVEDTDSSAGASVKYHEVVPMTLSCSDAMDGDEIAEPTV